MGQFDRRQALKLLAAAGASGLVGACGGEQNGSTDSGTEPVRVGLILPQTGVLKPVGTDLLNGFQLYLDLNERRLGGRPVNLLAADERETPESGQNAVEKLLAQNVVAMVGVANSALLLAVKDRVEQARVPLLAAGSVPEALQGTNVVWCTSYVDDEPGQALGGHVARELPANAKVAIVAPTSPAGQDVVNGFRQSFGPTDQRISEPIVWTQPSTNPGRDFFAAAVQRVVAIGATAVFCHFVGAAAVQFVKQLHAAGARPKIYGPGTLTEGPVLAELAEDGEGIQTALHYSTDLNNDANRRFAPAYRRAFGVAASATAVASYDAAQVLDRAIRIAGDRGNAQETNRAIGRVGQIDSPRGIWQFNQYHTPQQRWYLRDVRRDGQVLSNVTLSELATLG